MPEYLTQLKENMNISDVNKDDSITLSKENTISMNRDYSMKDRTM